MEPNYGSRDVVDANVGGRERAERMMFSACCCLLILKNQSPNGA